MGVTIDPVVSDDTLPPQTDVVVIGGGIVGVSTALFLAEQGVKVVLCEKGVIAGEQSSRNWGWCRSMGRDPRELPLMQESLRLWRAMNDRVGAETGFRQCGTLYACPDGQTFAKREAWLPHARQHGVDSRLLRGAEVTALTGGVGGDWAGALYTPGDGVAEPALATSAMARAARAAGAVIVQNCAVRGLDMSAGAVSGVVTEMGRVACDRVVLAGGIWSSLMCRSIGIRLPQLGVLATVMRTQPIDAGPTMAIWGPGLSLRKRLDGGYTVASGGVVADITPDSFRFFRDFMPMLKNEWRGLSYRAGRTFIKAHRLSRPWSHDGVSPFERIRTLDPAISPRELKRAHSNLIASFPQLAQARVAASWAGMIDTTPDLVPMISEVATLPGLVLSTGYSGHGFGIGPGAGRLTADIALGRTPVVDAAPFRFSRFTDGSRIRPEAGL